MKNYWPNKKQPDIVIVDYENNSFKEGQENVETITYSLAKNYNQILELLKQRKNLLNSKADLLSKQHQQKIASIQKAKNKDLKNQVKLLKDPTIANLMENSDKIYGPKLLLKKIGSIDVPKFQNQQKNKGLKFWDNLKLRSNEIKIKVKKSKDIKQQLEKISQNERQRFKEIQELQYQIVQTLTKKQKDFLQKADKLNQQIDKIKMNLKQNKIEKDRRKKQLIEQIKSLLLEIKLHQEETTRRYRQIQQLYGGIQNLQGFDAFVQDFQAIVSSKIQDSKILGSTSTTFKKLIYDYQAITQQILQLQQTENTILGKIQENYHKSIRIAILQKAYLSDLSPDRKQLLNLITKQAQFQIRCQQYRKLMAILEEQKVNINLQLSKKNQLSPYYANQLKMYENQDNMRFQLRRELQKLLKDMNELQENEKNTRNFKFQMSNFELKKKNILIELESSATKGNLKEYKANDKQLEGIEKQIKKLIDSTNSKKLSELDKKLRSEAQFIKQKYHELINQIINEDTSMTYLEFLDKLNRRLGLF